MARSALSPHPMVIAAKELAPRAGVVIALSLLALVGLWVVPGLEDAVRLLGSLCFGALLLVGVLVKALTGRQNARLKTVFSSLETYAQSDAAPVIATDPDGEVIYCNKSAIAQFNVKLGDTLARAFQDLFASPSTALTKLQSRAEATQSASEDVVLRRGHIRLSIHVMQDVGFLWRVDELGDRAVAGRSGENIALPMLTVSRNGTVLFMNEAARLLLGGRETTLDRIFVETPVRSGVIVQVSAKNGTVPVVVYDINCSAERKEMYLLPADMSPTMTRGEWAGVEVLPVPLLKLDAKGKIAMANKRARDLLADEDAVGSLLSDQVEGLGRPVSDWLAEAHAGRHLGRTEVLRASKPDEEVFLQIEVVLVFRPVLCRAALWNGFHITRQVSCLVCD